MKRWHLADTDYPAVRRVMADGMRLDDDALELHLERTFPNALPEDVENFMRAVQQFGRQAAPLAQRVLPGTAQGAVQGATVAGPWGALAGGVIGGVSGLLGGKPQAGPPVAGTLQPAPIPPATATLQPAPTLPPGPVYATPTPGGEAPGAMPPVAAPSSGAAAQLLALLSRPETQQALLAMLMRDSGRPAVTVGPQQVPPAAFANAIAELAAAAADDDRPLRAAAAEHLYDLDGEPRGDIVNPAVRAAILISDLAELATREAAADAVEQADVEDEEEDLGDLAEDDPLDTYERSASGWTTYA